MSDWRLNDLAQETEKTCRRMAEPFTQFVVCAFHLRKAMESAEERGRRAGIEERIWKRCLYPDTHPFLLPEETPMPKCGKPLEAWGDGSWRCADGHFNSADTLLREGLGRLVREVWVVWAHDQDKPKPHHLLPWEQISEDDKEVDRRIGETLLGIRDWRVGQTAKARALAPRDSGKDLAAADPADRFAKDRK